MIKYPIFLSSKPKFFGLELVDIAIFALFANLFNQLGLSGLIGAVLSFGSVGFKLLVCHFVDFQGLIRSYPKTQTINISQTQRKEQK